jgi:hypothetical protein
MLFPRFASAVAYLRWGIYEKSANSQISKIKKRLRTQQ